MKNADKISGLRRNLSLPVVTSSIWHYVLASLLIIITAGCCYPFTDYIGYQSVSFIFLFVVSILSIFMGIGPITLAAALSAIIWNFFFIPPKFTINIDKTEDALMFGMFFIIALVNGILTTRIRRQEKLTRDREEKANALYLLTKGLSDSGNLIELTDVAVKNIKINFGFDVVIILHDGNNGLTEYPGGPGRKKLTPEEISTAKWVFKNSKKAGKYSDHDSSSDFTFYPLSGTSVRPGVMAVRHNSSGNWKEDEFWNTFLTQISDAIEREFLNDLARKARFLDESDKLYKTLFNSISHELRIPVATIMSASESLLTAKHSDEIKEELSTEILKASNRLNRLIENLLNMSRLESGHIKPKPDWCDIHDLINKITDSLIEELRPFNVIVDIAEDMPLVRIDFGLMEQVLYNLVYNATQYASTSSNMRINASYINGFLVIEVLDRGPGIPDKDIPLIFNKFYRIEGSKTGGTGLGLSIAKGFTEAHNGTIVAENRPDGGAKFIIMIPSDNPYIEIK